MTSDIVRYNAAIRTFQDKYFALPGDLTIATKFWGAAAGDGSGTDAACWNASQTGPGTCNGNGDGVVNSVTSSSANPNGEQLHLWKQLADAGLIEGTYTGFPVPPNAYTTMPGINVPASKLGTSTGFSVMQGVTGLDGGNWYPPKLAPLIMFGRAGVGITEDAALKPEEAWNIDVKTDDGKPGLVKRPLK